MDEHRRRGSTPGAPGSPETHATVLNSSGTPFYIGNTVLNSSGTGFRVKGQSLDSDGNPFTIFT